MTRRTANIWSWAAAALAVAAFAGCSGNDSKSISSSAPVGRLLNGTFTITVSNATADPCAALAAHPDLVDGAAVEVRDATGNLLTTGSLGTGAPSGNACVRQVQLTPLPALETYQLTIGSYGPIEVDADSLDAAGGSLDLRLGA